MRLLRAPLRTECGPRWHRTLMHLLVREDPGKQLQLQRDLASLCAAAESAAADFNGPFGHVNSHSLLGCVPQLV